MSDETGTPPLTFGKERRLLRRSEFQQVKEQGRSYPSNAFVLGCLRLPVNDTDETPATRVGFVTTRKMGPAVVRNRLRRRLRELVRLSLPNIKDGFWLVLIPRRSCLHLPWPMLQAEWVKVMHRAKIGGVDKTR